MIKHDDNQNSWSELWRNDSYHDKHLNAGESMVENSSRRPRHILWLSWLVKSFVFGVTGCILYSDDDNLMMSTEKKSPEYLCTISTVQSFPGLSNYRSHRSIGPEVEDYEMEPIIILKYVF